MKSSSTVDGLHIFGGEKAFASAVHVGRPNVGSISRVLQLVEGALERRWLSNDGPLVQTFEGMIKERLGVSHVVATSNATIALELVLRACCQEGEVIVPSYTFIATAHAVKWSGLTPVFADVDPKTHHLSVESIASRLSERTAAILPVHLWGGSSAAAEIELFAESHNIPLLFDAAHAFACSVAGRKVGTFGAAEVFSFHATKFINCGEGGAITTNDGELARKLKLMRNFGFTGYDRVECLGTNAKMNEFSAAMGIASLESLESIVGANRENWECYRDMLRAVPGLQLHEPGPNTVQNYQYVIVEVDENSTSLTRDELVAVLHEENVFARRYFAPGCHRMEPYASLGNSNDALANTRSLADKVMALPTGTNISQQDIQKIGRILLQAIEQAQDVRLALRNRPSLTPPIPIVSHPPRSI
jgi:dTDP-4-amino-4,6-dideoxygalactose transaminase